MRMENHLSDRIHPDCSTSWQVQYVLTSYFIYEVLPVEECLRFLNALLNPSHSETSPLRKPTASLFTYKQGDSGKNMQRVKKIRIMPIDEVAIHSTVCM